MAKKTSSDLASSLLASFDALAPQSTASESASPDDIAAPNPDAPLKPKPAPSATKDKVSRLKQAKKPTPPHASLNKEGGHGAQTAMRSTITYHLSDSDMADEILDVLKRHAGVRASFSEAVRVALTLCSKNPDDIVRTWQAKREEDGRVLRHKVS